MTLSNHHRDLVGIGIGPSNLSTAALLESVRGIDSLFLEQQAEFQWFPGMLFPEATIQVSYLKDLVTLVDPTNRFSFLSFLAQNKRLYRFATARFPRIRRREFNQYFRWVASNLDNLQFGVTVKEVDFRQNRFHIHHSAGTYTADNIVVACGRTPMVPDCARPFLGPQVFHAIQYMQENVQPRNKHIVVVGGGQSGAEIVNRLLSNREELPASISWVSRRSNFLPIDDSPFTNEFFTPAYSDHFFRLPANEKKKLIREQMLASDGINTDLLEEIYRNLYEIELIEEKGKIANLLFNHSLLHMEKAGDHYTLHCQNNNGQNAQLHADIVIFSTGFNSNPPAFLSPLMHRLQHNQDGFEIDENFSIDWDGPEQNRIYIQNAARHVRGVADPNLSLIAWRSAKIINSLAGRNVYNTESTDTIFQWENAEEESMMMPEALPFSMGKLSVQIQSK